MQHYVSPKHAPSDVQVGDELQVASRGKMAWCARLTGKPDKKYGQERNFLPKHKQTSGIRKQIITYFFTITEPGDYEVAGNEFGEFRYKFTVEE